MTTRTVLSIGQCGADHPALSRMLRTHLHADVIGADTAAAALEVLRQQHVALVLVNRVFDWDGDSGQDFIRALKQDSALKDIPIMLVSNYDDAQKEAVQSGALPGFGKAALDHPQTLGRLRAVLGVEPG